MLNKNKTLKGMRAPKKLKSHKSIAPFHPNTRMNISFLTFKSLKYTRDHLISAYTRDIEMLPNHF